MPSVNFGSSHLRYICGACRAKHFYPPHPGARRRFGTTSYTSERSKILSRASFVGIIVAIGAGATIVKGSRGLQLQELHAEAAPVPADIIIEKPKKRPGLSKEDTRDAISSQHLQVKRSWENPGVYAWGSNSGRVAAPDSDDALIKGPRRISFFDGQVLRDLKLDRKFAAAISEKGDLYQWGVDYASNVTEPVKTLQGKNLVSLTLSKDRIMALSSKGEVFSVPVSRDDQLSGSKPNESSWIPFWRTQSPISYRTIRPTLSSGERITSISSGLEHILLLTSSGRVLSAAASSTSFPSRGQLGIPGLIWTTRPKGAYDQPHELSTLRGFKVQAIAAGDYHSLALDSDGRVFGFGDNTVGQLGQDPSSEVQYIDAPSLLPLSRLYTGSSQIPVVTSIAAGGTNSYFTVDATRVAQPDDKTPKSLLGRVSADTWACGQGIMGQLGTGRWTHVQGTPVKIKALSGLFEYDETNNSVIPIRLARFSVGATHCGAIMDNVTYLGAHKGSSKNDTNWGADVLWWGGNEFYQLGTGKRNNCAQPVYIGPLDGGEADEKREAHRFQSTPMKRVNVNGRWVTLEQRVECGRYVSAVYSGV